MAHSNPYCKISLLPDQKNSQQSSVQRKTQNPTWNEYFMFEIPYKEVQMRILEILVKDFDKYSRHCVIGQFHLALNSVIKLIKRRTHVEATLTEFQSKLFNLFIFMLFVLLPDYLLHTLSARAYYFARVRKKFCNIFIYGSVLV